ncbi:MAG: efflux RND transporter periplasmic adaptor subunit [Acidobacteriota bacterium]
MKKIGLILTILFLMSLYSCQPQAKDEADEPQAAGITPVKTFQVKKESISEKLYLTGMLEAWRQANVTSEVGGKIARIYVEEGQVVKEGELLAELETETLRLQLKQAEAGLAVAGSNLKDAQRNRERMERLWEEKAVSEQQYEKIKLTYEAAEAQFRQAQASLNLVRYNLNVSLMKAPFSGVIASKNAQEGDVINPMMGAFSPVSGVVSLMDLSRIKIKLDVSPNDVRRIEKNQKAFLQINSLPGQEFEGRVATVSQVADPQSKKFSIEVWVENPGHLLKPNTFGEVVIEVDSHLDALVVPQKAVLEESFVFVVENNVARRRQVVLGLQNKELIEITSGLKEGELVVIEGNYGLVEGTPVEIMGDNR